MRDTHNCARPRHLYNRQTLAAHVNKETNTCNVKVRLTTDKVVFTVLSNKWNTLCGFKQCWRHNTARLRRNQQYKRPPLQEQL